MPGQIRAGRQLSAADFGNLGLSAPAGLWNLSDLTDASGNGRNLNNKGAVTFAPGINGLANTAAQFTGSAAQALYIADTGAADPFRFRALSVGCWFRTAKRATFNLLVDKYGTNGQQCYSTMVNTSNQFQFSASPDGTANTMVCPGVSDVADDRWHFGVGTFDGTMLRVYVDGVLETAIPTTNVAIAMAASSLCIGGRGGDASNNTQFPHWGRIDEAFVTGDILSDDQVRALYCAKIAHTLGAAPVRVSLNVHRRRKGATLAVADFPTQPLRLHNFSAGSMGDQGSNNQTLTNSGSAVMIGADGSAGNGMFFYGPTPSSLYTTDAGLPAGVASKSLGCWFKCQSNIASSAGLMAWGSVNTARELIYVTAAGLISSVNVSDGISGPNVVDALWHFVVVTEDNNGVDAKRKLYLDGKLVGISTSLSAFALGGANKFRVGTDMDGTIGFTGEIDGVFVCDYALTTAQIQALYAKGAQDLGASPKNSGDHIDRVDAANILAVFDTLESQHQIDLSVA
jgi:hypothetical protein